jgi:hypothetical protein
MIVAMILIVWLKSQEFLYMVALFVHRGRILWKKLQIYDEMTYCAPKINFCEKSWGNYKALIVQIGPASSWIGRKLSKILKIPTNGLLFNQVLNFNP